MFRRMTAAGRPPVSRMSVQAVLSVLIAGSLLLPDGVLASGISLIHVGLLEGVSEIRLSSDDSWYLGIHGSGLRPTRVDPGEAWSLRPAGGKVRVLDSRGRNRGEIGDTLFAYASQAGGGILRLGGRSYRGEARIWATSQGLTAVNVVDVESYLMSVLPPEMGPQPDSRSEALKAQAIAARSYALAMLDRRRDRGFDVLPTVEDQVYSGVESERPACTRAVEETRGIVAVHRGKPIRAFYHSTCGGHTASVREVWDRPSAPYLRPVRDRTRRAQASFCAVSPVFRWQEEWTGAEFESMLDRHLPGVVNGWERSRYGALRRIEIGGRSESRRVSSLKLRFERGTVELAGDSIRRVIRRPGGGGLLRSSLISRIGMERSGRGVKIVRISGQGFGHGIGMCQYGAMGMAEAGYSYDQIIRFYYRGAKLQRFY